VRFVGPEWAYWQLRIKGAALLLVTLGIYRFWLMTDVRRFLWSNTEIAGEMLEYDGLATELLLGFLFAIAILFRSTSPSPWHRLSSICRITAPRSAAWRCSSCSANLPAIGRGAIG
jgi:uncharacterized membrane protein YjgN (DUF898 family)